LNLDLTRMFRYVAWADRRSLESVRGTPAAQPEALPLIAHILAAEHVWLSRLQEHEPRLPVWPKLSLEECETQAAENEVGYQWLFETVAEDQLVNEVRYRNAAGQEFATSMIDILSQVITHGPYHRGQIAKIVARSGGTPINTDFIMFTRDVE
jgi:uncharacterized damage-inducible protein DinB